LQDTPTRWFTVPAQRIITHVVAGVLWVIEPEGDGQFTYCADPVTGSLRARLPLLPANSAFATADSRQVYYFYEPLSASTATLQRAPINTTCLG
jgi:hypothetical protein